MQYELFEAAGRAIMEIIHRGNDAEVRRKGNEIIVLEVKKTIKERTPV